MTKRLQIKFAQTSVVLNANETLKTVKVISILK